MATIKDVAARSGFSTSTVSIILNGKEKERKIPEATVEKVYQAITELNYRPSRAARRLRGVISRPVIALFWVLDKRSTFFMRLVRGIEEVLRDPEYPCELVIHPYTNGQLENEKRLLLSPDYQGILIGAMNSEDEAYLNSLQPEAPVMVINRKSSVYPFCTTSVHDIGAMAASFALEHCCRTLGVATDKDAVRPKTTRRDNVIASCKEAGVSCSNHHYLAVENSISGGIDAAKTLMNQPDTPDMVYLDNDLMALGFSLGCYALGIRDIPILCIGLNHPELGQHLSPSVTLIDIPGEELGRQSARQMTQLLSGKTQQMENIVCPCSFVKA